MENKDYLILTKGWARYVFGIPVHENPVMVLIASYNGTRDLLTASAALFFLTSYLYFIYSSNTLKLRSSNVKCRQMREIRACKRML